MLILYMLCFTCTILNMAMDQTTSDSKDLLTFLSQQRRLSKRPVPSDSNTSLAVAIVLRTGFCVERRGFCLVVSNKSISQEQSLKRETE